MSFFSSLTSLFSPSSSTSSSSLRSANPQRHQRQRSRHPQGGVEDAFDGEGGYDYREPGSGGGGSPGMGGSGRGVYRERQASSASPQLSRNPSTTTITGGGAGGEFSYPPNLGRAPADGGRVGGYDVVSGGAVGVGVRRAGTLGAESSSVMRDRNQPPTAASLMYYPPLPTTWSRIKASLAPLPELIDTLNYPVDPQTLILLETTIGSSLPQSVRDSYATVDGQDTSSECREGLFFGLTLLTLEDVLREWSFWKKVADDPGSGRNPAVLALQSSIPPGWVKSLYASRGWVPLIADKCGNYIGVDLDPSEEGGQWGQVIMFGREFDRKCVLWRGEGEGGWGRWLAGFAEELESGEGWEFSGGAGRRSPSSDDEEDEIGYSSYYFDGTGGDSYGDDSGGGGGLRLTGEHRGMGVLAALWDRSVKRWEELGLGVPEERLVQEERMLEDREKRRLSGMQGVQGLGFGGMRLDDGEARVAIPVIDDPDASMGPIPPSTPGPQSALLEPFQQRRPSEELPASSLRLRELQAEASGSSSQPIPSPAPLRLITPVSPTIPSSEGQRQQSYLNQSTASTSSRNGLLSPPSSSPTKKPRVPSAPPPAPAGIDLPTRADVQAAQAVALAESSGLRGGWVMSMEAARSGLSGHANRVSYSTRSSTSSRGGAGEEEGESSEMVDIDLEAGGKRPFGSPKLSAEEAARMETEMGAGPSLVGVRTPSPLSMMDYSEDTPRPASAKRPSFQPDGPLVAPPLESFEGRAPLRIATDGEVEKAEKGEESATPTAKVPAIRLTGSSAAPSPVDAGFRKSEFETVEV